MWLSEAVSVGGVDIGKYLAQYGLFGAAFFDVFITRKFLVPRWARDEAVQAKQDLLDAQKSECDDRREDIKELKSALDALQSLTREQMLPALVRANQLSADYLQEITRRGRPEDTPRPKRPGAPRRRDDQDGN